MPESYSVRWTAEDTQRAADTWWASDIARAYETLQNAHPDLQVVFVGLRPLWGSSVIIQARSIPERSDVRDAAAVYVNAPSSSELAPVAGTPLFGLVELAQKIEAQNPDYIVKQAPPLALPSVKLPWWAALGLGVVSGVAAAWGASKAGR